MPLQSCDDKSPLFETADSEGILCMANWQQPTLKGLFRSLSGWYVQLTPALVLPDLT